MAITNVGESQSFSYTGNVQTFTAPFSGVYKFDIKGGSAGSGQGGQGGTSIGYKLLKKGDIVFVCVGGAGNAAGAYNGGGTGVTYEYPNWTTIPYCCGGGATHIALVTGTLAAIGAANIDKILIVAGGGGGNYYNVTSGVAKGGNGGGLIGGYGVDMGEDGEIDYYGSPGTQTSGYAFGQGGSIGDNGGGGGGGLYGGYAIHSQSGSGGSGYIGGVAEFSYKGVTYTPSTTNGGNAVGAHGSATITLVEKAIVAYIGDTPIITMYLGDKEIEDISELW